MSAKSALVVVEIMPDHLRASHGRGAAVSATKSLALGELALRLAREQEHARNALRAWARTQATARQRRGGRCDNLKAREWRRYKRHMRRAARVKAMLFATGGQP